VLHITPQCFDVGLARQTRRSTVSGLFAPILIKEKADFATIGVMLEWQARVNARCRRH
jgi:hypothetical protein